MSNLYGCHGRPRPVQPTSGRAGNVYTAQSGWREDQINGRIVRFPVWETVPFRMSSECQYDKSTTDPRCAGCRHITQPAPEA